jgi:hypothetical protein
MYVCNESLLESKYGSEELHPKATFVSRGHFEEQFPTYVLPKLSVVAA